MAESKIETKSSANKWAERLRGKGRMAVAAIGGMFAIGFFGVSQPLSARIDTATERLAKASARAQLAGEVSEMRHQAALYEKRLTRGVDPNDWTNYLLDGIRAQNVKLLRMDPKDTTGMGPCKVLSWQIDIEGDLDSLGHVVSFLENGQRLVRIDRVVLSSGKEGSLGMALLVKGLALDIPLEKVKEEKLKAEKRAATVAARKAEKNTAAADADMPQAVKDAMPKMPDTVKIPGMGDWKLPKPGEAQTK